MALRFVPTGDIEAAGRLKGVGWRLLHDLKRRMSFQKLFQDKTILRTGDGTIIECLVCGALDTINVFVPVVEAVKERLIAAKVEGLKYRIYCVLIEYNWWKGGDVTGYVLPEEAYKQMYLKVDENGAVSELQEGEIQGFVLKTPVSEFKMRERLVNNESANFLEPLDYSTDSSYCSLLTGHSSYLYTPNLPTAAWRYLLKMPNGRTLNIAGHNTGIAVWDEKNTVIKYKAALQGTTFSQSEHTHVGYTRESIVVKLAGHPYQTAPITWLYAHKVPMWRAPDGGLWGWDGYGEYEFVGWRCTSRKNQSISIGAVISEMAEVGIGNNCSPDPPGSGTINCLEDGDLWQVGTKEYSSRPSVTHYSCVVTRYEDHSPNIENINEVSTFLNFANNYRIFKGQEYNSIVHPRSAMQVLDNSKGYLWENAAEGLILASKGNNNTVIIKLSEPELNYVRVEYNDENISLEIIEGEMPELSDVVYDSISGIKEYNPILVDLYSYNTEYVIARYLELAYGYIGRSSPFPLLPESGFTNFNIKELAPPSRRQEAGGR